MISLRYRVLTLATLAIAGCAPTTYSPPGYVVQSGTVVYDNGYGANGADAGACADPQGCVAQ